MELFAIARAVILFIVLIFCCIGTAGPQYVNDSTLGKVEFYFYQTKSRSTTTKHERPDECTKRYDTITAGYAFAIISCIVAGVALIASVAQMFVKQVPGVAVIGLTGFLVITLLISWAISEGLRTNSVSCEIGGVKFDDKTPKDQGYDIAYGLALLITAWVLSIVAFILSVLPMVGIKM